MAFTWCTTGFTPYLKNSSYMTAIPAEWAKALTTAIKQNAGLIEAYLRGKMLRELSGWWWNYVQSRGQSEKLERRY
jgi:hypothetical protein